MSMPSFTAERTLGRLAKWLRIMGFDTVYESDKTRAGAAGTTVGNRVYLTRTLRIARTPHCRPLLLIRSNDLRGQLREVVSALDIRRSDVCLFSRCLTCNRSVRVADKTDVRGRVPDYVWADQEHFSQCPKCLKIFWSGTHADRTDELIRQVFENE